jgi:hypothetical protein
VSGYQCRDELAGGLFFAFMRHTNISLSCTRFV